MASIQELQQERLDKINNLEAYPSESFYTKSIKDFLDEFQYTSSEELSTLDNSKNQDVNTLVGRVMSMRSFGALAFGKIFDGSISEISTDSSSENSDSEKNNSNNINFKSKSLQIVFEKDINEEAINFFAEHIDVGDFVQVTGTSYITKKGENSVLVTDIKLLAKALLPLPDKHAGLQDEEEKMRKRYLDILLDENKRDLFYKKAKFWKVIRSFLDDKGFLEVETPTIETTTGGAEARPFKTFHNDYDMDVYMRICVGELWQKRLMAAGFPKTYEIGRAYRNEGSSPEHLQEFTNCEFYAAYTDYKGGMKLVRELYIKIAQEVFGKTNFEMKGHNFNLDSEWTEIDYASEILKQTGIDIWTASDDDIKNKLKELGVKYDGDNRERLTDTIWKYCRKSISGPAFLINHPLLVAPLAKVNADGRTAQVFQPIIAGSEIGRGYSELNDSRIQKSNFENQQKLLEAGDDEAMMPDYEFVEMLEHGMPPTCGYGFGDRLFAFLAGLPIRETQMFPLVKPKVEEGK